MNAVSGNSASLFKTEEEMQPALALTPGLQLHQTKLYIEYIYVKTKN